jgi:hypothetical protein
MLSKQRAIEGSSKQWYLLDYGGKFSVTRMAVIMCVVAGVRGMIMMAMKMPAMQVTLKVN